MPIIEKTTVKEVVIKALKEVGDFDTDNIENFSFVNFKELHIATFLLELSKEIEARGFELALNQDIGNRWNTAGDCIDYIIKNAAKPV